MEDNIKMELRDIGRDQLWDKLDKDRETARKF
jgi:hypothetical protein